MLKNFTTDWAQVDPRTFSAEEMMQKHKIVTFEGVCAALEDLWEALKVLSSCAGFLDLCVHLPRPPLNGKKMYCAADSELHSTAISGKALWGEEGPVPKGECVCSWRSWQTILCCRPPRISGKRLHERCSTLHVRVRENPGRGGHHADQ